jgi:hypothetical protein
MMSKDGEKTNQYFALWIMHIFSYTSQVVSNVYPNYSQSYVFFAK